MLRRLFRSVWLALTIMVGVPIGVGMAVLAANDVFPSLYLHITNWGVAATSDDVPPSGYAHVTNIPSFISSFSWGVYDITVVNAGTGYVPGDTIVPALSGPTVGSWDQSGAGAGPAAYLSTADIVVASTKVVSATIAAAGTTCAGSSATLTGTTGSASTLFTATVAVSGGSLTGPVTITNGGQYVTNPTTLSAEPVTGDSCTGAQLNVVMGVAFIYMRSPGWYTGIGAATASVSQTSTSGSGTGFTGTAAMAPWSVNVVPDNQAAGTGAAGSVWNTRVGYQALSSNTLGNENSAFGWAALSAKTTGNQDAAFGVNALGHNTTGANNAAFGTDALRNNVTASGQTALGNGACKFNLATGNGNNTCVGQAAGLGPATGWTGTGNVIVGQGSMGGTGITTASTNVFVGNQVATSNSLTTAQNNVCVGSVSCGALQTGGQNVAIGVNAGNQITTGSSNVLIGNTGTATGPITGARNLLIGTGVNSKCNMASDASDTFAICSGSSTTHLLDGNLVSGGFQLQMPAGIFAESATDAISAAGSSSQSAATVLTTNINKVTTVAANAGVALPACTGLNVGADIVIMNYGANTLLIWPVNGGSDTIDALSANVNTTLSTTNRIAHFYCVATHQWRSALGGAVSS